MIPLPRRSDIGHFRHYSADSRVGGGYEKNSSTFSGSSTSATAATPMDISGPASAPSSSATTSNQSYMHPAPSSSSSSPTSESIVNSGAAHPVIIERSGPMGRQRYMGGPEFSAAAASLELERKRAAAIELMSSSSPAAAVAATPSSSSSSNASPAVLSPGTSTLPTASSSLPHNQHHNNIHAIGHRRINSADVRPYPRYVERSHGGGAGGGGTAPVRRPSPSYGGGGGGGINTPPSSDATTPFRNGQHIEETPEAIATALKQVKLMHVFVKRMETNVSFIF